jgi:sulfite exporter TauE/SafE
MVLFGVSYAIASLGCTLPIFLVVVAGTNERANAVSGALAFLSYCLGMTVVLMTVSVALALARDGLVRRLRELTRFVDRASGALLVVVGVYLVWYGIKATDPTNGTASTPLAFVESWSTSASTWLSNGGAGRGVALAVVVALAAGLSLRSRRP